MKVIDLRLVVGEDVEPQDCVERLRDRNIEIHAATVLAAGEPRINTAMIYVQKGEDVLGALDALRSRPD